ncbi:MAG: hypothetical protein U1F43_39055 [Myxococcota bacterium]
MRPRHPIRRWLAVQVVVLAAVARAFRAGPVGSQPGSFGYLKSSPYGWMPWLVLLSLPADGLLLAVALPAGWEAVGWVLLGATAYLFFWVVGVGVTMRERPHRVSTERVELRNGVLGAAVFEPAAIAGVRLHPGLAPGTPAVRRYRREVGSMLTRPGPFVEVALGRPVTLEGVASDRQVSRVAVQADDVEGLRAALAAVAPTSEATPRSVQGGQGGGGHG